MSSLLGTLEPTIKSVALLVSSRSLRHIRGYTFHSHRYARSAVNRNQHVAFVHHCRQPSASKVSEPLHILFCGSDEFSCASLEALHHEHTRNPGLIQSISVVVRPGKRTGRGYKIVRDPPIRGLAHSLGLPIHERDTFTGWNMPGEVNLIVAVSFGLFVPPRLLRTAKYGGLNVHPSLLPDLRGPAPLQHALLSGRRLTGVSLQTLDHKAFDHGIVLAQTPADPEHKDALRILPDCTTVPELQALVTPVAAQMLVRALHDGLHVPPLENKGWTPDAHHGAALLHAPKITKQDRQVTLSMLLACDQESSNPSQGVRSMLGRRQAAIGPLWFWSRDRQGTKKRIIIEELKEMAGFSLVNRPSMIGGHPDQDASTKAKQQNHDSYRRYIIPFEGREHTPQDDDGSKRQEPDASLVFWNPIDPSPGSDQTPEEWPSKEERDGLCLGNFRVLKLKVEGDKVKPARLALHNFINNIQPRS
ncbi:Formyltransferase [Xylariaceae sp. AK1471]|nr:Formyltransferase [Xylariaceae sp. AK1471]